MKKLLYVLITLLVLGGVTGVWLTRQLQLGGGRTVIQSHTSSQSTTGATSTRLFLTASATSTYAFNTENAEAAGIHMLAEASSTASVIRWVVQASNDGTNWFDVHCSTDTAASKIYHENACYHTWAPSTVATSSLAALLPTPSSKFYRLRLDSAGANASVWIESSVKKGD